MIGAIEQPEPVGRSRRWGLRTMSGATVWLTGLSGSGKSTVAGETAARLAELGRAAYVLDADNLRLGLTRDLGYSEEDRAENVRRVGEVAALFAEAGIVAIVPIISPSRAAREAVRAIHQERELPFIEVYMSAGLEVCELRDPKGLYQKTRAGEITNMTGIGSLYEPPEEAEVVIGESVQPDEAAERILSRLWT